MQHRKLQHSVSSNLPNTIDNVLEWCIMVTFGSHLLALIAASAVVMIVAKLLGMVEVYMNAEDLDTTETDPLRPTKVTSVTCNYGTISVEDIETTNFSCNGNKSHNSDSHCSSSSKDLYDGKLCVICYDERRDCFFVPCGHCATCNICAQRIFVGESKTCPVCRRLIAKVKRLPTAN